MRNLSTSSADGPVDSATAGAAGAGAGAGAGAAGAGAGAAAGAGATPVSAPAAGPGNAGPPSALRPAVGLGVDTERTGSCRTCSEPMSVGVFSGSERYCAALGVVSSGSSSVHSPSDTESKRSSSWQSKNVSGAGGFGSPRYQLVFGQAVMVTVPLGQVILTLPSVKNCPNPITPAWKSPLPPACRDARARICPCRAGFGGRVDVGSNPTLGGAGFVSGHSVTVGPRALYPPRPLPMGWLCRKESISS
mmetsp:Transcript_31529/g.75533  ORF Transcript_31529/g.75533 Transcript_31529/m.75533 type:complete len:248 (+) Transcript_31529:249-992(+)